ncbi:MAG TPA: aspartate ammonia-lyase [Victivallales bacterium]|nr:aspartate ammonia-lyase [Victivallales bacterium]
MLKVRIEEDFIGKKDIPVDILYGIHTARAVENFEISRKRVNPSLIHAYGAVKLACAITNYDLKYLSEEKFRAIEIACRKMIEGELDSHIVVDALQGGAGTSTNMNVNEVIANFAIISLGSLPGNYSIIHPIDDVNMHQSTNDTYPTALRTAALFELKNLEKETVKLLESLQKKEKEFSGIVKIARTEMMDAVLSTLGKNFSAFAEAVGRDRWRIYKCEERLKVVNLGGTAIGTGLGAPRKYIFKVVENLRKITGLPLARAENLYEATQNQDAIVETSGILRTFAVDLAKISNDLRLMASGPEAGLGEIKLPALQTGSSIMPGKVNPVIPEAVLQEAITVISNDVAISTACASANLELNHLMPLIADKFLESLQILANSAKILSKYCIEGIIANEEVCKRHILSSTASLTALINKIPYSELCNLAKEMGKTKKNLRELILEKKLLSEEEFNELISPENVNKLGFD